MGAAACVEKSQPVGETASPKILQVARVGGVFQVVLTPPGTKGSSICRIRSHESMIVGKCIQRIVGHGVEFGSLSLARRGERGVREDTASTAAVMQQGCVSSTDWD